MFFTSRKPPGPGCSRWPGVPRSLVRPRATRSISRWRKTRWRTCGGICATLRGAFPFGRGRGQPRAGIDYKREGAFYVWTDEEIGALLGDDADIVRRRFGLSLTGNAPNYSQGEFDGAEPPLYGAIDRRHLGADREARRGDSRRARPRPSGDVRRACDTRPRPHLDDKVITSWNGTMVAAVARAARAPPQRPDARVWLDTARDAASVPASAPLGRAGGPPAPALSRWRSRDSGGVR